MSTPGARVLLVDDHPMVRAGLRVLLHGRERIDVVGEAATVSGAITEAARLEPDVILMDLRLPDGNGIDACREIRAARPATRVLFLTSYPDPDAAAATLLAGAAGFLLKDIAHADLVDSILAASDGRDVPGSSWPGAPEAQARLESATRSAPPLSPQEARVMQLVVRGKTNREIAAELRLSEKTVKNYLSNIFQKLGVGRRAHAAAVFARRSRP